MPVIAALVVAAGRGSRFGGELPKQYADLGGKPVLYHALRALAEHPRISTVVPVIHPDDSEMLAQATDGLEIAVPVEGGSTRQASVLNGLDALSEQSPDLVLIHDGARPRVTTELIDRVINSLESGALGAIPVLPVPETLKRIDASATITETLDREGVVRAQTPQGFHFSSLIEAHRACEGQSLTDDAAILEAAGHLVVAVEGDRDNIKVTTPSDLTTVASTLLETRTGTGFDVHRFESGQELILGGISIPFDKSLAGHSDADVVLHAATDAVLGALGDGDIGLHFPPSDDAHKGAPSDVFLRFAVDRLQRKLGRLLHLDITVICERPKLSPHRDAMRARIAEIAGISIDRISVKATTTEGLGFTGRGEGIACQATATVQLVP